MTNTKTATLFLLSLLLAFSLLNFASAVSLNSNLGTFSEGTQFKVVFSYANDYGYAFYDGSNLVSLLSQTCAGRYEGQDLAPFDNCPAVSINNEVTTGHMNPAYPSRELILTPTLGTHNFKLMVLDYLGFHCAVNANVYAKLPGTSNYVLQDSFIGNETSPLTSCYGKPERFPAGFDSMNDLDSKTFNFNIASNSVVTCSSNAVCGANVFLGNNFCSSGNVFRNFITFTCVNPGTTLSYCTNSTSALLNNTCAYGCTNGVCNSQCAINANCGSITLQNNYCVGSNIRSNYSNPVCTLGICGVTYSNVFNQTCANGCTNGSCNSAQPTLTLRLINSSLFVNQSLGYIAAIATGNVSGFNVNDTHFDINASGYLKNITAINLGTYWLNISVNDIFGNSTSGVLYVNVTLPTCVYTYSAWSVCNSGTQTRTNLSSSPNPCIGSPVLSQSCSDNDDDDDDSDSDSDDELIIKKYTTNYTSAGSGATNASVISLGTATTKPTLYRLFSSKYIIWWLLFLIFLLLILIMIVYYLKKYN